MRIDLGKISVTPKGAYNSSVVYERLDIVSDSGKSYLSRIDSNNKPLTDDTAWQLLVEGGSGGGDITEADVTLPNDYSDLDATGGEIITQQDLNKVLARILKYILNTQSIGDKNYIHTQFRPDTIWTINHPLNKRVNVTVIDTAGTVVEGKVTIKNDSEIIVEFNTPFSGKAILN